MNKSMQGLLALVIIAVLAVGAYAILTMPDRRSTGQRVGDAIDALPNSGVTGATRSLESRTPGEKLGDGIKDMGQGVKDSTSR